MAAEKKKKKNQEISKVRNSSHKEVLIEARSGHRFTPRLSSQINHEKRKQEVILDAEEPFIIISSFNHPVFDAVTSPELTEEEPPRSLTTQLSEASPSRKLPAL